MPRDLEKVIGKDIRQATRYAEGIDEEVSNLQAAIQQLEKDLEDLHRKYLEDTKRLENEQKEAITKVKDAGERAREAWAYVDHLKEKA